MTAFRNYLEPKSYLFRPVVWGKLYKGQNCRQLYKRFLGILKWRTFLLSQTSREVFPNPTLTIVSIIKCHFLDTIHDLDINMTCHDINSLLWMWFYMSCFGEIKRTFHKLSVCLTFTILATIGWNGKIIESNSSQKLKWKDKIYFTHKSTIPDRQEISLRLLWWNAWNARIHNNCSTRKKDTFDLRSKNALLNEVITIHYDSSRSK